MNPRVKPLLLLAVLAAALLAGADIVHRAKDGHGRWHQLAKPPLSTTVKGSSGAGRRPARRNGRTAPMVIYDDALGDGWENWSWSDKALNNPGPDLSPPRPRPLRARRPFFSRPRGNRAIYLHHSAFGTGGYGTLQAFVYGDTTTRVCLVDRRRQVPGLCDPGAISASRSGGSGRLASRPPPAGRAGCPAGRGRRSAGVVFQPEIGAATPALVVDDLSLLPDLSLPPAPTAATVARGGQRPVGPASDLAVHLWHGDGARGLRRADLRLPLNRWGGNDKTRYNWVQGNAENAARDWQFRNRVAVNAALPPVPSSAADAFVRADKAHGAATLLTVPTIGWVARDTDNANASVNVPDNGGPGLAGTDGPIAGYDPTANRSRTSVRSVARKGAPFVDAPTMAGGVVYQDEWIHHLKQTFGDGAHGGVQFFAMDNEPDLWDATHTDVHPARMGYDDVLHNFLEYATAVKAVDPAVLITGPVSWGWTGYNHSALDRGDDNFKTSADTARHGGTLFLPWFLTQVRAHDLKTGRRTLDVLDVHFYPQAGGVYGGQTDKPTQALRLRATRSLWDPTYRDESWVGVPLRLIPRLHEWIAQGYPGTRLGITEWNFGADSQINGGLAIADVLGIYGREGVYLADYWAYPNKDSPGYLAFKLYRNPDGRGDGFGDVACSATSADQGRLAVYAATDSRTGELTLMLINKMSKATITAPLSLHGAAPAGTVKMWRSDADNPKGIAAYPPAPLPSALTLPPQSMTLLRLALKR